jgi:L-amino acid N-acyltransferase
MKVRLADVGDADAIRAIYNDEVVHRTNTFDLVPRTLDEQIAWLDAHAGAHPAIVGEVDGEIVGFGSLSPYRDRPAYATTVEDSVYVRPERQGNGYGTALLEELLRLGRAHGFHAMVARIVGHNESSIGLHVRCGFELVGTEREVGRKFGQWLDVVELYLLL